MDSTWPNEVAGFEVFLEGAGLMSQRREEQPVFNNKVLQYGDADIGVRVVSDKGVWYIEVADVAGHPNVWYEAALLRGSMLSVDEDIYLPLTDQIEFVETQWPAIISRFSPAQREDTHARLASLRKDRAKRRFPGLYPQNNGPS